MKLRSLCCHAALTGALLSPGAHAAANPPIQIADGVEYMCGGANREEAAFLQRVAPRWSTELEFGFGSGQAGAFTVPVQLTVRNRSNGDAVMQAQVTGPTVLMRLAPGSYEVEAVAGGIAVARPLTVIGGSSVRAAFLFPSNVDFTALAQPPRTLAQVK
jgi:hypothetical protein